MRRGILDSQASTGLGQGAFAGDNATEQTKLPKGVHAHDLEGIAHGMQRRRISGSGREYPGQLSLFPGEVLMLYGPGT